MGSCLIASIKSPAHTCTVHTGMQAHVENRNLKLSILKMMQESELQALKMITGMCSIIENWECVEKQDPSFTLKRFFSVAQAELSLCTKQWCSDCSNNCPTIDGLTNNKPMSGFGIPTAKAQRFIALEWCTSVFFITGVPQQIYTWWR